VNVPLSSITYTFGGGATGVTVSGLPAGVTSSINNGIVTIGGTPTVPGNYPYSIATVGPCANQTINGIITVSANSTISLTSGAGTNIKTLCLGTPLAPITYSLGGGATGATVVGLPTGINATVSAGAVSIAGSPSTAGVYNYTIQTTGPCVNPIVSGTITVEGSAIGGILSPNITTVCTNTNTGVLSLSGQSGTIVRWESSSDGGTTWTPIANTTPNLSYGSLSQTTIYRAVLQNGSGACPLAYSTNAVVSIVPLYPPTSVSATPPAICVGDSSVLSSITTLPPSGSSVDGTFNVANPPGWRIRQNGADVGFPQTRTVPLPMYGAKQTAQKHLMG
jgi:hypothetical protein